MILHGGMCLVLHHVKFSEFVWFIHIFKSICYNLNVRFYLLLNACYVVGS